MAFDTLINGERGDYGAGTSWIGGVAPGAGDTAVISSQGDTKAALVSGGNIFALANGDSLPALTNDPIAEPLPIEVAQTGTNPTVFYEFFPDSSASPPGEVTSATVDLTGGGSVAGLSLQNSTLGAAVQVSGTALLESEFTNLLTGNLTVGLPFSINGSPVTPPAPNANGAASELDINVLPLGSWTYSNGSYALNGYVPAFVNEGSIDVGANSALRVQLAGQSGGAVQIDPVQVVVDPPEQTQFVNDKTISIDAGGFAGFYGETGILTASTVPDPVINNGNIDLSGAAGQSTALLMDAPLIGGTVTLAGNGASNAATTATLYDTDSKTSFVIDDATLQLSVRNYTVPQYQDQFSGGTITFGDNSGVLAFVDPKNAGSELDTITNNFSDTINGFRAGDQISLTLLPGVLSAINIDGTFSFAPIWNQSTNRLQIEETVKPGLFSPVQQTESQIVADLNLAGTYDPSSFDVSWSPDPYSGDGILDGQVTLTITTTNSGAPCFVADTLIATPDGEVPVQSLRPQDRVLTLAGPMQVRWVGHRRTGEGPAQAPIRIRKGALGDALPRRDLLVSPDHALFFDGVLVPAELLIDGEAILREPAAPVSYHHVELERHAILFAEGAPAESYLDTGNRARFANCPLSYEPIEAAVQDPCAEMLFAGARLEAVLTRLRSRRGSRRARQRLPAREMTRP